MATARDNPEIYFPLLPICRQAIVNKVTCRHLIEGQRTSPPKPQNHIQGVTQRRKFPESDSKVPRCPTALQMSPASAQHQSLCVHCSVDLPCVLCLEEGAGDPQASGVRVHMLAIREECKECCELCIHLGTDLAFP